MSWYIDQGPESDVIISSRIRLARNMDHYPFPHRMTPQQARKAADEVVAAFFDDDPEQRKAYLSIDLDSLDEIDRMALAGTASGQRRSGAIRKNHRVIISRDEALSS
jgi:protein arginine kinase